MEEEDRADSSIAAAVPLITQRLLLPRSSWLREEEASAICHAEDGPEGEGEKGDFSKKELPRVHQETVNPS